MFQSFLGKSHGPFQVQWEQLIQVLTKATGVDSSKFQLFYNYIGSHLSTAPAYLVLMSPAVSGVDEGYL